MRVRVRGQGSARHLPRGFTCILLAEKSLNLSMSQTGLRLVTFIWLAFNSLPA